MTVPVLSQTAPPAWTVLPFVLYLLVIALTPLFAGRFWEKNRNKLTLAALLASLIGTTGASMLTPLGDPPLFLGFLRGVDFLWTLQLWKPWLAVNAALLVVFNFLDQVILDKEELELRGAELGLTRPWQFFWAAGALSSFLDNAPTYLTFIGNGPNFMVKAIAEEAGVRMPSFFGYMLWSVGILVPLFVLVTLLFFV